MKCCSKIGEVNGCFSEADGMCGGYSSEIWGLRGNASLKLGNVRANISKNKLYNMKCNY